MPETYSVYLKLPFPLGSVTGSEMGDDPSLANEKQPKQDLLDAGLQKFDYERQGPPCQ